MHDVILIVALTTVAFSVISRRIDGTLVTAPMIFTGVGLLLHLTVGEVVAEEHAHELLEVIAELTLVIVLFIDASRINLRLLIKDYKIPARMLGVGLPLTILLGATAAKLIFPEFSVWEAVLLSAILAPTDAALGQTVVSSPDVPPTIRQSLSVESGLNDGIVLPLVILSATLVGASQDSTIGGLMLYWGQQVTVGPLIGIAVGFIGERVLEWANVHRWSSGSFQRVSGVSLALLAWSLAILLGGNGFIAAFLAGLTVSSRAKCIGDSMQEFGEAEGQWLTLTTFLLFGMLFVSPVFGRLNPSIFLYSLLSLTAIRMLPVMLSVIGLGFRKPTFWFLSWFGPRGLASLLFALLIVSKFEIPHGETIFDTAIVTVVLSIFAHGISAAPASRWYKQIIENGCRPGALEIKPCSSIASRRMFEPDTSVDE